MPIRNFPFLRFNPEEPARPWLPVKIINPKSKKAIITYGLVDTGADKCAIPDNFAESIGFKLTAGRKVTADCASGTAIGYLHTTNLEILDYDKTNMLTKVREARIEYTEGLPCVVLGTLGFLDKFTLKIDYPNKTFSITSLRSRDTTP